MALSDIISTPPISADTSSQELFNSYVRTSLRHKHLFPLEDLETTRLESVVKRAFREANAATPDRRIDAAFIAMRKLAAIWNAFAEKKSATAAVQPVMAPFDVQIAEYVSTACFFFVFPFACGHALIEEGLLSCGCQSSSQVGRGTVLIAHPLMHGPLARAVIVVLDHGSHGTYGLMVNRPTPFLVSTSIKVGVERGDCTVSSNETVDFIESVSCVAAESTR